MYSSLRTPLLVILGIAILAVLGVYGYNLARQSVDAIPLEAEVPEGEAPALVFPERPSPETDSFAWLNREPFRTMFECNDEPYLFKTVSEERSYYNEIYTQESLVARLKAGPSEFHSFVILTVPRENCDRIYLTVAWLETDAPSAGIYEWQTGSDGVKELAVSDEFRSHYVSLTDSNWISPGGDRILVAKPTAPTRENPCDHRTLAVLDLRNDTSQGLLELPVSESFDDGYSDLGPYCGGLSFAWHGENTIYYDVYDAMSPAPRPLKERRALPNRSTLSITVLGQYGSIDSKSTSIYLINPAGQRVGRGPLTGEERYDDAGIFSDRDDHFTIFIRNPVEGEYTLLLFPSEMGFVSLSVSPQDFLGEPGTILKQPFFDVFSTSTIQYRIRYSQTPDAHNELMLIEGDVREPHPTDIRLASLVVGVKMPDVGSGAQPEFQIIDPELRRTGYDATKDIHVFEIPQSRYFKEPLTHLSEYRLTIAGPIAGEYALTIFPRIVGAVSFHIFSSDRLRGSRGFVEEQVDITTTSTLQYVINYSPEPGSKVEVRRIE